MPSTKPRNDMKIYRGEPRCFNACVSPKECNPLSHGGVTYHEIRQTLSEHFRRSVNSTGFNREERGPWEKCSAEQAAAIRGRE